MGQRSGCGSKWPLSWPWALGCSPYSLWWTSGKVAKAPVGPGLSGLWESGWWGNSRREDQKLKEGNSSAGGSCAGEDQGLQDILTQEDWHVLGMTLQVPPAF